LAQKNENKNARWRMGGITNEPVEDYLYSLLPDRDEVVAEIEDQAARRNIPIVGPAVARVFFQLAKLSGAKKVFEMGSAIGYSTIWWARAVGKEGSVIYTDSDQKNASEAQGYFKRAGVEKQITICIGDALEMLSEQKESFDIIFCDIDKEDYPRALRVALPKLRKGGMLVTDNALWSGKVADKNASDAHTKAIREFNRLIYNSPDLFTTILPLRDGVAVCVKS
jgi:caffeoyl-CoA O-methyltransferase